MGSQKNKALGIARRFVRAVQRSGIDLDAAFLYGSYASGTPHEHSDIDIALISKDLTGGSEDLEKIRDAFRDHDARIETVRYHPRDFRDESPLVWEIKQEGISLLPKKKNTNPRNSRDFYAPRPRLNVKAIVNYWLTSARSDRRWASDILKGAHRNHRYALSFGRLFLEKMLKAVIVSHTHAHAPARMPIPDLAKMTGITFAPGQLELFSRVNQYTMDNIDNPENEKLRQLLTRKFCEQELEAIRKTGSFLQARIK